jgi:hypothetical protein
MACVGCRSVRLKCEKQEGGKCKRCEEKSLDCVLHARKRRAPSGSCERCVRLHKACSLKGGSEDEAVRCHECLRLNAVCEPFDPSKSAKVDEEPSVEALPIVGGEENLSVESLSIGEETFSVANRAVLGLALRAPSHLLIQELEKLPPSDVPGIFGLGSKTLGSTWLLVAIPPPGPEGFTHEGFHKVLLFCHFILCGFNENPTGDSNCVWIAASSVRFDFRLGICEREIVVGLAVLQNTRRV